MPNIIDELTRLLVDRQGKDPDDSYVAMLYHNGLNKILEKVIEEAGETVIAAKDAEISGQTDALVKETADLWFHSMVMLQHLGVPASEVLDELQRRFGTSGHTEKASRSR